MKEKAIHLFRSHFVAITIILLMKVYLVRTLLLDDFNIMNVFSMELSYLIAITVLVEMIAIKGKPIVFLIYNLILSAFFLALLLYHAFFGRIVTYYALFQLGQVGTINESVTALLEPVHILFFVDIVLLFIFYIFRKYPLNKQTPSYMKVLLPAFIISFAVSAALFFHHKESSISNNVIAAEEQGIFNYEAIEIYNGPENQIKVDVDVQVDNTKELKQQIRDIKQIEYIAPENRNYFGAAEDRNLIIIQVESMQEFPVGLKIGGKEVTPNINRLMADSFYFSNTYQQTGPGNTSDAEFMVNTSIYPLPFNPTSQTYGEKKFPSLPRLLKKEGYSTMTFHADEIEFWNRDELYPALGFEKYYDETFFGNKDIIGIGASDEVMFETAMPILKNHHENNQPFYAHLVGLTSHHPFTLPGDKDVIEVPDEFKGSLTGNYLKSINYVDQAIGKFIEDLKANGMYENSIIAIYGDHFGLQQSAIDQKDVDLVSKILGHEYETIDRLHLPFMITAPGIADGQEITKLGGQMDYMPTIANLLGLSLDDQVIFGQDLLNHDDNLLGVRYYLPVGSFFNKEIMFIPEKGFEDGTAYSLQDGSIVEDFAKYKEDYDRVLKLEKISDTYMKSLPERE